MATIANLTKKDDGFSGTLILPSLNGMKITFEPVKNPTDKGPDYRVIIGGFEAGAAWSKTSKKGNAYISVKLSEPSFHGGTIYPVVVKSEKAWIPPRLESSAEKEPSAADAESSEF
jgi:uncharacterized protein (DUF736 family)